ncbi:MAG: diguanylate cyclase, partial [Gemmatimonadetes bacterium]|nr:diguanylate cyclase [Gemmatimonadota bacterium]
QGHPVESNPVLQKMLGYSADELRAMVFTDFTHPEDVAADWRLFQEVVEGRRDHYQIEKRYIRKDGQVVWGRLTASLVCGPDGAPSFGIGMVEDITEAKHAEVALRVSEERYRNLFEGVPEGLYRSAPDGTLLDVNLALVRMLGYPDRETLLAVDASRLYPSAQQRDYWQNRMAAEGVVRNFETQLRCFDGSTLWVCDSARAVCDAKGRVLYYEGALEDITERKQAEEELRNLSLADELTGLYNRRGFFTLAEKQLRLGDRTQRGVLLVFADVDGMKRINDTLGHQMGDQALKEAAELLKQTFRASDILARFGGDEFVVLAIETGKAEAESLTRRLCEKLEARNAAAPAGRELSISMGVVYYEPETGISIDDLLSRADRAMYEAKRERLGSGAAPAQGPTA